MNKRVNEVRLDDGRVIRTAMNPNHPEFRSVLAWFKAHPGTTTMKPAGFNERGAPYRPQAVPVADTQRRAA